MSDVPALMPVPARVAEVQRLAGELAAWTELGATLGLVSTARTIANHSLHLIADTADAAIVAGHSPRMVARLSGLPHDELVKLADLRRAQLEQAANLAT